METYQIKFIGRKVGAIGITQRQIRNVEAENVKGAVLKLYDTHEHITDIWINDIKLEHWNKGS